MRDSEYHETKVANSSGTALKSHWRRKAEAGQAMVEIAFLLPMFLIFVFFIFEIGRAWAVKQSLTIAAREGARVLVLPYGAGLSYASEGDVKAAARTRVESYLNSSGVGTGAVTTINLVRVNPGGDQAYGTADDTFELNYFDGKRGERVGIRIDHQFETPLPFLLAAFSSPAPPGGSGGQPQDGGQPQSGILMGVTCHMVHE
ncbi:MAG: pilus assembly protein [Acidobacteria bacterium]|nr:pilus assembly protein [Acidobacteriota bacterium]